MSIVTLGLAQTALSTIELAIRDGKEIDAGVLGSFNAGISHLLLSGREPGTSELQALHNLLKGVVPEVEELEHEAEPAVAEATAKAEGLVAAATAEAPVVAQEAENLVHEGEASVKADVAEGEAAASAEQLTETKPDPLLGAGPVEAQHLFGEHPSEDDGA